MLRRASRRQVIDAIDLDALAVAQLEPGSTADERAIERTEDDLLELVANQPDDIAAVLRQWLSEPEGVR